ncbi:MAG: flagellar biosynthetic protein FliR [Desulfobacteraceae bacterium]|nr:flagellar biosynthetic protein FliR [Desulfobacteraceae bacterium]
MEILNIIEPERFRIYLLVLMRVSIVLFLLPIFSSKIFPVLIKMAFAMVLSLLLYSVVQVDISRFPMNVIDTGRLVIMELMIGLTLGLCIRLFFAIVQFAGQIVGFQMGFAMINVVDPQTGTNVSIMDQLGYWVCVLVFLTMNGHHLMFLSLIDSFAVVPIGFFMIQKVMLAKMLSLGSDVFLLGIKIGAPIIAALVLTSSAFGLVARFSPQMNVMIVAFPLKILVGLLFFGLLLDIIIIFTREYIEGLKELLMGFLFYAGGG